MKVGDRVRVLPEQWQHGGDLPTGTVAKEGYFNPPMHEMGYNAILLEWDNKKHNIPQNNRFFPKSWFELLPPLTMQSNCIFTLEEITECQSEMNG